MKRSLASAVLCLASPATSFVFQIPPLTAHHRRDRSILVAMSQKEVVSKDAPAPVGPYSQAVLTGNTLYCSGQVALDPATGAMVGGGDVVAEARQIIKNMDAVLVAAGAGAANVVRTTVFLADLADFAAVNEVYAEYFDGPVSPARACVQVAALPKGAKVEIDCIAVL